MNALRARDFNDLPKQKDTEKIKEHINVTVITSSEWKKKENNNNLFVIIREMRDMKIYLL